MTEQEIQSAVQGILSRIAPEADLNALASDTPIREALDIDSFDYLRFITELHKILSVEIPEADYPQLATLGGILNYLKSHAK